MSEPFGCDTLSAVLEQQAQAGAVGIARVGSVSSTFDRRWPNGPGRIGALLPSREPCERIRTALGVVRGSTGRVGLPIFMNERLPSVVSS